MALTDQRQPTPRTDETGKVYGRLTVLGYAGCTSHGKALWLCRCECGVSRTVVGQALRFGNTTSCGCQRRDANVLRRKYTREDSTWRILYKSHAQTAHKHGCLPFGEWKTLVQQECFYCGSPPPAREYFRRGGQSCGDPVHAHGVDRIDSSRGYELGNVVTACEGCNVAKFNRPQREFFDMCLRVVERHGLGRLRLVGRD